VAENIATNESAPLCPVCERSDMVRLYYERHFCDRCWLAQLASGQRGVGQETPASGGRGTHTHTRSLYPRRRRAEGCRLRLRRQALPVPRARARVRLQTWECPRCRAQYPRPKGAGVCPACALGENPETVALVPLEEGT
jgi:hypothetical protein